MLSYTEGGGRRPARLEALATELTRLRQQGIVLPSVITEEKSLASAGFPAQAIFIPALVEKQRRIRQEAEKGGCFFCEAREEALPQGRLAGRDYKIVANNFPYLDNQLMLVTVDHRDLPDQTDFQAALDFQRETGLTGMLNLKGSGASLADHLHFEFGEADLPILKMPPMPDYFAFRGIGLTTLNTYPGFVLVLYDRQPTQLAYTINQVAQALFTDNKSFNLVLNGERVLLIPRPTDQSSTFANLRVGSLFLSGLFVPDARQSESVEPEALLALMQERFSAITPLKYRQAIKDTTLPPVNPADLPAICDQLGLADLQRTWSIGF